jgi:DNA-binding transcriptional regulator YdaS (Cro superfamily)
MDARPHIEAAIRHAGSEAKLGAATGFSQHAIWRAKRRGSVTPAMALAIHRATGGAVPASLLRPDLWPTDRHVPFEPAHGRVPSRPAS